METKRHATCVEYLSSQTATLYVFSMSHFSQLLPLAAADADLSTRLTSLNPLYTINALLSSTTHLPSIGQTIWKPVSRLYLIYERLSLLLSLSRLSLSRITARGNLRLKSLVCIIAFSIALFCSLMKTSQPRTTYGRNIIARPCPGQARHCGRKKAVFRISHPRISLMEGPLMRRTTQ